MTSLLQKAFTEIQKLPDFLQDQIAQQLLQQPYSINVSLPAVGIPKFPKTKDGSGAPAAPIPYLI
ncbi:hypothetical protein LQF76_07950 [Gloeomargaritales cyanobacterium VI4D9]|nr:hypothetical protein LQF76_07950 [Gloeomargaritales cyanobacterium VI4D9]